MRVSVKHDVSDELRGRIRAAEDRSGKATREEFKAWLDRVVTKAAAALPPPKTRRKAGGEAEPRDPADLSDPPYDNSDAEADRDVTDEISPTTFRSRFAAAVEAPAEAICKHCGKPKASHGRMGFTCLWRPGLKRGQIFEAVEEGATV